jgi:tetratricopeptide (TPR) repeat protein
MGEDKIEYMNNLLKALIVGAETAIENVKLNIQLGNGVSCTIESIDSAIRYVEPLLEYEQQGIKTTTPPPSELIAFLEQKRYEIQDPDHLYDNVNFAQSVSSIDNEDSELIEVIEKCKTSNNAHDKLALAIIYKNLGENHSEAAELLKSYIDGNYINPFYTKTQMLFMLAELYKNGDNPAEAINTYTRLLKIAPDNAMIYIRLIELLKGIGRQDLATKALNATKNTKYYKELSYFKDLIDNI